MHRLGLAFTKWIEFKMVTDPFWKVRLRCMHPCVDRRSINTLPTHTNIK